MRITSTYLQVFSIQRWIWAWSNLLFSKCILIFISLILTFFTANAQFTLSGAVSDSIHQTMPGVNVLLLNPKDSTLFKGGITDGEGKFSLANITNGAYLLSVSSMGYKTFTKEISMVSDKEMGMLILENDTRQLNEVAVTAARPFLEQKLDRLVVNVQNSITAAGGSALDVLERSPGVVVNRGTNALSLNGKEGIVVMINGKVTRQSLSAVMQLLNGLNANSIEKIELITNPPAKYEAAGNGGIINIQLSKSTEAGTNGSVSVNAGYGQREKAGTSINFNHRQHKSNFYGDFSYARDHRYAIWTNARTVVDNLNTVAVQSITYREPISTILNGRLGMDYQLTDKTSIGAFVSGFSSIWDMDALTDGSTISTTQPSTFVKVDLLERGRLKHLMGNINLNQQLGQKTKLNLDLDYLYYKDKNETTYDNLFSNEAGNPTQEQLRKSTKRTPINIWVASLDFTSNLGKKLQMEYGMKGIFSKLNNDVIVKELVEGQYVVEDAFTEISQLRENIGAVYASANYALDAKTDVKAGLRYEYSTTILGLQDKGNVLDLTISKLFPTLFLSRKLAKETTLQLSYGRRITRPSYGDLAPFFIFLDPTTFSYGNTSLKPALSSNVKLGFTYKQYMASIEHTHEDNAIEGYQPLIIEGTNRQVYTTLNLDYKKTTSLVLSLPVKITSWWNMQVNILGVRDQLITPQEEKRNLNYYRINLTKNLQLPADFSVELSGFYQSASLSGISRMDAYQSVNLGVAKKFNNASKLKLSFNNMFGFNFDFYTANADNSFTNLATFRLERRIFNLTYSHTFGNQQLKSKRSRSTGSDEIRNRIN